MIANTKCQRCSKETMVRRMSMFNTQMVCPNCIEKEKSHPMYAEARRIEFEHVKNGNMNFEGIGLPDDLAN